MVDRLRDTCESHARCNVVEVMGRDAGDIASGLNMTSIPRNLVFTPGGKLAYDDSGMLSEAGLLNLIDRAKRLK